MSSQRNNYFGYLLLALLASVTCSHQGRHTGQNEILLGLLGRNKLCVKYGVYINETRKCYPAWSKGPCEELMVVTPTDEKQGLGKCDCQPTFCGARPIVYVPEKNRCYKLFDQGPCAEGEWLVASTEGVPSCENILCPEKYNLYREKIVNEYSIFTSTLTQSHDYAFPYKNNCYIAGSLFESPCPEGYVATFENGKFTHVCSSSFGCWRSGSAAGARRKLICPWGGEPDRYGGCEAGNEIM